MINISLPDGSVRKFDKPVSGAEIAASIGPGLAKAALALRVDGKMVRPRPRRRPRRQDRHRDVDATPRRWSCCATTRRTCWPRRCRNSIPARRSRSARRPRTASITTSCASEPFSPEDFAKIEQRMAEIVDRDLPITREVWDRARIKDHFQRARREASRPSGPTSCPRTRRSRSTSRATGSTCASARTCPRRASSARPSS